MNLKLNLLPYSRLLLRGPNICKHHLDLQKLLLVAKNLNVFVQYFFTIEVVYFKFLLHTWCKIWKSKSFCKYLNSKYFFLEEIFTSSQIFGPRNNNLLCGNLCQRTNSGALRHKWKPLYSITCNTLYIITCNWTLQLVHYISYWYNFME